MQESMENDKDVREKLTREMEVDARIIAGIIEDFVPQTPFEVVETDGLKIGVVRDIPYMDENPKITKKLLNNIEIQTGYVPQSMRDVGPENSDSKSREKTIMLIKDMGGKLGKSISLGKDTIYMGVLIFDDR